MSLSRAVQPSILGKALSYPLRLDDDLARPVISEELTQVRDSIKMLISTDVHERPFLRRSGIPYGTRLRRVLFENSDIAEDICRYEIKRAIDIWEPRTQVLGVYVQTTREGERQAVLLQTRIYHRLRATSRDDNFVIPYRFTPVR